MIFESIKADPPVTLLINEIQYTGKSDLFEVK